MKSFMCGLSIILLLLMTLSLLFLWAGLRVNTSDSIPKGLYWLNDEPLVRGRYVLFCPPNSNLMQEARRRGFITSGFCPGGLGLLMKKIAAIPGDEITSTAEGIMVNETLLPFSQSLMIDANHQPLPQWHINHYCLKNNEFLVMTDQSPWSFDSRYFGLINSQHMKGTLNPLWIWPLANSRKNKFY